MNSFASQLRSQFPTLAFDFDSALPRVHLACDGARAEVILQGAHLSRFQTASGDDMIFASRQARFEQGKSFHNGVPVVFPWFGPNQDDSSAPAHGFARQMNWDIEDANANSVTLSLQSNAQTLDKWPHPFRLSYGVRLEAEKLGLTLQIFNTGDAAFRFETALHTYLRVGDVRASDVCGVEIGGLDGKTYLDKPQKIKNPRSKLRGI